MSLAAAAGDLSHQLAEIIDGFVQSFRKIHGRRPSQKLIGGRNIRSTLHRIILRKRPVLQLSLRADGIQDFLGKCRNGEFPRIAKIDRPGNIVRRIHQSYESVDEVVDVAE